MSIFYMLVCNKKMLNASGEKKREIEMSRHVMCINNLKKLGDVVRISV